MDWIRSFEEEVSLCAVITVVAVGAFTLWLVSRYLNGHKNTPSGLPPPPRTFLLFYLLLHFIVETCVCVCVNN